MALHSLSFFLALSGMTSVLAQSTLPATPLVSKTFAYPNGIPYKADTDTGLIRGGQFGYNLCNSTTEGTNSLCQTSFVNSIDDFCLWAPSKPNSVIADTEGEEVAWCTKPGRGTRLIPKGALQGVQFTRTPDYVQVVGFIQQSLINMKDDDFGGELDPHGADLRGNPLGGLMYSNAFPSNRGNNATFQQVFEWHNFMGGKQFCIKVCDPAGKNAAQYCQHIYDRIGCAYNAPSAAKSGVFESCQGENQDFPGVYVVGGVTSTYTQPPESLGAITTIPYTARIPASSNCATFDSASIYAALPTGTITSTPTSTAAATAGKTPGAAASKTDASTGVTATSTGGAGTLTPSSMASFAGLLGVVFGALLP
jgi:hypothetical protein